MSTDYQTSTTIEMTNPFYNELKKCGFIPHKITKDLWVKDIVPNLYSLYAILKDNTCVLRLEINYRVVNTKVVNAPSELASAVDELIKPGPVLVATKSNNNISFVEKDRSINKEIFDELCSTYGFKKIDGYIESEPTYEKSNWWNTAILSLRANHSVVLQIMANDCLQFEYSVDDVYQFEYLMNAIKI